MTKDDLVKDIAGKTGIEKITVVRTLDALMDTIKSNMIKGENVYLRSFGSFLVKKRAKKTARNIRKNTIIIIPEHFVPTFKPAKEFTEKIKANKP
jgi:DNA-binding protein HU-beta